MNKRAIAFELFDEGKTPTSPEVKALKLKGTTRYNYFYDWQKDRGTPRPSSAPSSEAKTKEKVISELEMIAKPTEEVTGEEGEVKEEEEEEEEPEPRLKVKEKPTDGKKFPATMVAGQGLTFAVTVSTKTLMLYQIAASQQEEELTLGDFVDGCVEDVYQGRGLDLGLIKIGGRT